MAAQTIERSRLQIVLGLVALVALVAALLVLTGGDEQHAATTDAEPASPARAGGASSGVGQSIAPSDPDEHGGGEQTIVADGGRVYMPGKGWATVVDPGPNAEVPPPIESLPENPNPPEPPPEELPQTAAWKLGKTERIHEVMQHRVDRLARQIEEARRAGNDGEAARLGVLLERSRRRVESLAEDIARLREEAASESPEEEVVREWEQETGIPVDRIRERDRVDLPPPPESR